MLTKNNVIQLYNDGLAIRWRRKKHPQQLKGEYDPAAFEVSIYTQHLLSEHDRDMTLLHELIHAKDDRKGLQQPHLFPPRGTGGRGNLPATTWGAGTDQGAVRDLNLAINTAQKRRASRKGKARLDFFDQLESTNLSRRTPQYGEN
ncbi:MAG: hypothetical protein NTW42_05375 [Deltaproteobacteria bacterium]|nr:hypothetical protein [Deltaproteobacteria bacterium]